MFDYDEDYWENYDSDNEEKGSLLGVILLGMIMVTIFIIGTVKKK